MSIILFLAFVGSFFAIQFLKQEGEAVAARLGSIHRTEVAKLQAEQRGPEQRAGPDRRQAERRSGKRRQAA